MQNQPTPVVNPLPLATILLVLPMVAAEIYFVGASAHLWGSEATRYETLSLGAYSSALFEQAWALGQVDGRVLARFVVYPFFHTAFLSAAFGVVLTLALSKFVAEVLGSAIAMAIFFTTTITSALFYGLIMPNDVVLYGAHTGFFGLIGSYSFILFSVSGGVTQQKLRAFQLLGFLLAINVVFSLLYGGSEWVAELFAALFGFFLTALLRPGGLAVVLHNLRKRR